MNDFTDMIREYTQGLSALRCRREELGQEIGVDKDRLAALDEEIDETEEVLMLLRRYTTP